MPYRHVKRYGGFYKQLLNTDKVFEQYCRKGQVIVLNDLPNSTVEDRRKNTELVQAIYRSERIDDVPSCRCGELRSLEFEGITCSKCGFPVSRLVEDETGIVCWLRAPRGVDALINPTFFAVLQQYFTVPPKENPFDFLRWMMDPRYNDFTGFKKISEVRRLAETFSANGFKRGYNSFIRNFDAIMEVFLDDPFFRYSDQSDQDELHRYIKHYRHSVFVKHIPSPPPGLLVLEETDTLTYKTERTTEAVNAIRHLLSIDTKDNTVARNERLAMLAMFGFSKFAQEYAHENERQKTGLWRMHVYAMRIQLSSFRGVIYSLHEEHMADETILPWSVMVKCLYFHLANLLDKRGYSYPEIVKKIALAIEFFDPEIKELLDILIEQFKNNGEFKGPATVQIRFPTLGPGNIAVYFVTGYTLPNQGVAIGFPGTNVTAKNADFDGDTHTGFFTLDMENTRRWVQTFGVHNNVVNPNVVREMSRYFPFPRPFNINVHNMMEDGKNVCYSKVAYMEALCGNNLS